MKVFLLYFAGSPPLTNPASWLLKTSFDSEIRSDHVDLDAANKRDIAVLKVTGSNFQSFAKRFVKTIPVLVQNFVPSQQVMA
ncbi:hypothetical protein B0I75DRAFT_170274 [Yarrowia lipolytica]|nr:hypothetical protein BKA91DRAFT_157179 [Yarrowia lipolytica]KAE8173120.1 hypothetical protein BKA90DRAFT_156891 [Yarrowia lipolytica]RDW51201.1 hypothetical protein B0I75DRAFT_170274 [Yarrowia lipolytica]